MSVQQATAFRTLVMEEPEDVRDAVEALAGGCGVAHGFGNVYALTSRTGPEVVQRMSAVMGRPAGWTPSVTTTSARVADAFDWTRLPADVPWQQVRALVDELLALGPFGFRGPAADRVPGRLTRDDGGTRTVQVVVPGSRCPSNAFLGAALDRTGDAFLAVTAAGPSRHRTGTAPEPAHWRADGLASAFADEPGVRVLAHTDEAAARRRHPFHEPTAVTVLSFHRTAGHTRSGLPMLTLERHGSLSADHTRALAANHGFGVALAPGAAHRLTPRVYAPRPPA